MFGKPVKAPKGVLPGKQFYKSEKEEGVYIEKPEKRIKSFGELGEITFKGLAAQKSRRATKKRKNIFNIFGG